MTSPVSTYFECDPPESGKRKHGYSRDHRPDCVQVVIALIVTPDGFPLAYEVLPGNTLDKQTLKDFLGLDRDPVRQGRPDLGDGVQLQSFPRLVLVISVAPLGLIGVVGALLPTYTPMSFIAILGPIALIGMIIRNSVILIDQIESNIAAGVDRWDAVVEATGRRLRPIMLTAAAAILGTIPIASDSFWRPMAMAIMWAGGGDAVDAAFPAGGLCGVVPYPRAGWGKRAGREGRHR
jgi:hypothetical protein